MDTRTRNLTTLSTNARTGCVGDFTFEQVSHFIEKRAAELLTRYPIATHEWAVRQAWRHPSDK